jgi:WD40-like Beta Propeller Repeat
MAPGARWARGARALLGSTLCLATQSCDGELVNLGRSEGLTGGDAGNQTVGGAGSAGAGGSGAPTWRLQETPIVDQTSETLLANPTLTRELDQLYFTEQPRFGTDTRTSVRRAVRSGSRYTGAATVKLGDLPQVDVASPGISIDGNELWLGLNLPEGVGGTDVWLSRKAGDGFTTPELVAELSSPYDDAPRPAAAAGTLMPLSSKRHGGKYYQIYLSARASPQDAWGEPSQALVPTVNGADFQSADGFLADTGKTLYFSSNRADLQSDLYVARRDNLADPFGEPALVPDLNLPSSEERMPWLSEDGQHLFFASNRSGRYALYRADRR